MTDADKLAVKYIWHWCPECNTMGVPSVMHQRFCRHYGQSLGETDQRRSTVAKLREADHG